MLTVDVQEYARALLDEDGFKAIAEAAQRASALAASGNDTQAQLWRRVEAALIELRGPHAS